jgi:hypothetical protein
LTGSVLLALHPFGDAPPGNADGDLWFALNGAVLALAPVAALMVLYWPILRTPLPRYGMVSSPYLGGGVGVVGVWAVLASMLPLAAYSRDKVGLGAAASLLGVIALGGFLEIQRRCRLEGAPDGRYRALVVQWDALWAGLCTTAVLIALTLTAPGDGWEPLLIVAIGGTACTSYLSTAVALASERDYLGLWACGYWIGVGALVVALPHPAVQLAYVVGSGAVVAFLERHRRARHSN